MGGVWSAIFYVYMLLIWAQLGSNDTFFKNFGRFRGLYGFESIEFGCISARGTILICRVRYLDPGQGKT